MSKNKSEQIKSRARRIRAATKRHGEKVREARKKIKKNSSKKKGCGYYG